MFMNIFMRFPSSCFLGLFVLNTVVSANKTDGTSMCSLQFFCVRISIYIYIGCQVEQVVNTVIIGSSASIWLTFFRILARSYAKIYNVSTSSVHTLSQKGELKTKIFRFSRQFPHPPNLIPISSSLQVRVSRVKSHVAPDGPPRCD